MGREPSVEARRRQHARQHDRIHDRMTVLALAGQPTEMIDSGAGQVDERAVEPSLIDTLIGAAVAGDGGAVIGCSRRSTRWSWATVGVAWVAGRR
jgi:hypothetical protein